MQSYKHYFLALLIALSSSPAFAKQFWQESQVKPDLGNTQVNARADEARYVSFRHEEMEKQFLLSRQFMELAVPAPDGKNINIRLVEDSVMAPGLAAKFPGIKSYKALNELGEQIGRFSYSHKGLRGMYKYNNEWAFLDPLFTNRTEQYISYFKSRAKKVGQQSFNEDLSRLLDFRKRAFKPGEISVTNKAANTMRTYRIAVTATGEYTEFHGGTVADALAAINSMINRINQVYLVDMAVQFQIVDNNDAIIYRDGETDPFSNNTDDIDLNQQIIDEQIGSANYDIGHIVNTSDGGLASLGSVCSSSSKAQGVTGLSFPTGDTFYIDYVAHEIGHQFDAGHTFNGSLGACAGSRTPNSSWEPGSGSTIMGYASICESQNIQSFSDAFFHIGSIAQMRGFIDEGLGGTCGSETSITNITPTVDAGEDFNIPANTPFTLTGSGSDADGDELTYIWEQLDLGAASSGPDDMVDNGNRPLFRSFMPQSEPVRTLPQISDVFAGTTTLGETYPTTARDLNFVLTARDNNGGLAVDTMVVRTTSSVSGFTLMQPNETKSWEAGRQSLLYWNNAGSDEAPISCNSITLDMTNDDGSTYITISTDIVNDSLAVVTAPSSTGDYRFRLRCENNIFFTISAGNISIVTATSTDTDSDGMSDEFESDNGLDPNDASDASLDSDGDGLSNLEESLIGSNINNADSDNDGLPDAFEIANYLDPIDASDADADADGDGVSNLVEYQQGSDPNDPLSNPFVSEQVYSFESATELDKWTLYGSVPWRLSTDEANDGVISLQAGEIFDGGLSILSYIDVMAAGSLAFDVKLSTEEGFDFLHIFVNDVNVLSLSGIADWTTYSIPVGSGANVIQWVYAKDDSVSVGQDTVWIDNIRTPVSSETFVSDVSGSNTESSFQFESTQGLDNWSLMTVFHGCTLLDLWERAILVLAHSLYPTLEHLLYLTPIHLKPGISASL